jgi:hypothetical protein
MTGPVASPIATNRRWAISLADLSLLLVCCMLAGGAGTQRSTAPTIYAHISPDALFYAGEARLHAKGVSELQRIARTLPKHDPISIAMPMKGELHNRMDAWELAAARTAAIGRFLARQNPDTPAPILLAPSPPNANPMLRISAVQYSPSISDTSQLAQSLPVPSS